MRFDRIILKPLAHFAAMGILWLSAACATLPAWAEALAEHHSHEWDRDDEDDDTIEMRQGAGRIRILACARTHIQMSDDFPWLRLEASCTSSVALRERIASPDATIGLVGEKAIDSSPQKDLDLPWPVSQSVGIA